MLWGMKLVWVIAVLWLMGCASHAGPYVTNISSDGRGGLNVEKCMAKFDPWMSTVNNDQCASTNIRVGQETPAAKAKE